MITPRSWLCHFQILVTSCVMLCDTGIKPYWVARMPMSRSMLWRNMYYTLYSTLLMVQMESLTMQQGDYTVPATYQTHILYWSLHGCTYIWLILLSTQTLWMSIESSTYGKYLRSCAMKSFSWAWQRCNFFASGDLHILGHIIKEQGIIMDPHKVTTIPNWKVPTNKILLASFIGAVGFLANDCKGILILMGVLTSEIYNTQKLWTQDQLIVWHIWHQLIV